MFERRKGAEKRKVTGVQGFGVRKPGRTKTSYYYYSDKHTQVVVVTPKSECGVFSLPKPCNSVTINKIIYYISLSLS